MAGNNSREIVGSMTQLIQSHERERIQIGSHSDHLRTSIIAWEGINHFQALLSVKELRDFVVLAKKTKQVKTASREETCYTASAQFPERCRSSRVCHFAIAPDKNVLRFHQLFWFVLFFWHVLARSIRLAGQCLRSVKADRYVLPPWNTRKNFGHQVRRDAIWISRFISCTRPFVLSREDE